MAWTVKFYRDLESGDEPARDWLVGLTGTEEPKRLAALAAVECVLKVHGTDVCETEWGKNLGNGLYEFRVRHPAGTIRHMFPIPGHASKPDAIFAGPAKILLRIFFTTYGPGVLLLLSGYDKGSDPSNRRQQREMTKAAEMAAKAQKGLRARLREQKRRAQRK
ncbi:MAG: hypothetical protein E6I73_10870 [Chloroflexi bacterium]|nr:MAG: hypothetical protein E6I73_10870 [Chloroflexota bacterium]